MLLHAKPPHSIKHLAVRRCLVRLRATLEGDELKCNAIFFAASACARDSPSMQYRQ